MKKVFVFLISLILIVFPSCRDEISITHDYDIPDTWSGLFDIWWTKMSTNYVFWDLYESRGVDWREVKAYYDPLFTSLGLISDGNRNNAEQRENTRTAFRYFFDIIKDFSDGHYHIAIKDDYNYPASGHDLNSMSISPSAIRKLKELGYSDDEAFSYFLNPDSSDYDAYRDVLYENVPHVLEDTFGLDIGEGAPLDQVSDEGFHGFETFKVENIPSGSGSFSAATSRSSDGILYFGFSGFSFSRGMGLLYSDTESDLWKVMDEFFSALADEETKGIIIDMRGNEGGNVAELRVAFSAFFPAGVEKIHFADTRRKSGEGMLEYGPWLPFEVSKDETMTRGSFNEDIPIAVLVNGESMSCAEFSVMFFSALRERYGYDVTFVGSRTKGATGEVVGSDEIYNAGSFEIQPYITEVHTPFCQTRYFDGTIYEGVGIGVDVDGGYSYDAFSRGDDPALTKAVGILEEKICQMESSFHL